MGRAVLAGLRSPLSEFFCAMRHRELEKFGIRGSAKPPPSARRLLFLSGVLLMPIPPVAAERVRLRDGTEFSAEVLERDAEHVMLAVPRGQVDAVDGEPLPAPVAAGTKAQAFAALDLSGVTHAVPDPSWAATLVQFWATWCPHCRADLPLLTQWSSRYGDRGLRIVSVSVDKDLKALRGFVRAHRIPYPVVALYDQPDGGSLTLPERYEMRGVPAYYVIDAQGVIAQTVSGSISESGADVEGTLKRLVGG
ncbi:MAG: redoxin domain-containing protein [Candidatus Omnitrophica bacterium]|nr:redoxin domain-containing protein [Candidatus Omnitrophota bacterium]